MRIIQLSNVGPRSWARADHEIMSWTVRKSLAHAKASQIELSWAVLGRAGLGGASGLLLARYCTVWNGDPFV